MNAYRILVKGIVKQDDKYLIVKKWHDDNISDPYQWEFVDGEADFGESPDDAVLRILKENAGLDAQIDRILYTWTFMLGEVCSLGLTYLCYTDSSGDEVQLSDNLEEHKWVTVEEFEDFISNQRMLEDIEKAELYDIGDVMGSL